MKITSKKAQQKTFLFYCLISQNDGLFVVLMRVFLIHN